MHPENAQTPQNPAQSTPTPSEYEAERRRKRDELRAMGLNPYGRRAEGVAPLGEVRRRFEALGLPQGEEGPVFTVAGRIILKRDMGKLSFLTVRDESGDLQVALQKNRLGEVEWEIRNRLDLGDQIVAAGPIGTTKTGEPTIWATSLQMSSKSLLVPPDKHKGLEDVELRYRQRYVDLWANPETMELAKKRIQIVDRIRQFWRDRGFLEVETPMLQPLHGGAAARPFVTHMNALDMPLYLRIAPELYLKRLLVGGFRKVFEINRNFRNEGISPRHNPEFTMLEAYEAYGNYETMAQLVEEMICTIAQEVFGTLVISHGGAQSDGASERRSDEGGLETSRDREGAGSAKPMSGRVIDLRGDESKPVGQRWRRVRMDQLVRERLQIDFEKEPFAEGVLKALVLHYYGQLRREPLSEELVEIQRYPERLAKMLVSDELLRKAHEWGESLASLSPAEQLVEVYEKLIEPTLIDPTFVTHVPSVIIPLARPSEEDPYFAEVYELAINGQEISPGYTELNDPDVQEQLFRQQVGDAEERQQVDEDFLTALKYGMPPAGGMGLGVDRLVTMLTGAPSLRDVILFPLMRPR